MLYALEQGPNEQKIIDLCIRQKRPLPESIANAPDLEFGLDIYYNAFTDLHTCRSGMGDGPIPWITIEYYADRMGMDQEQRELLHYVIAEMDDTYGRHVAKKNK